MYNTSANSFETDITFTVRNANGSVIHTYKVHVTVTVTIPEDRVASSVRFEMAPFVDPKTGFANAAREGEAQGWASHP